MLPCYVSSKILTIFCWHSSQGGLVLIFAKFFAWSGPGMGWKFNYFKGDYVVLFQMLEMQKRKGEYNGVQADSWMMCSEFFPLVIWAGSHNWRECCVTFSSSLLCNSAQYACLHFALSTFHNAHCTLHIAQCTLENIWHQQQQQHQMSEFNQSTKIML